jgi:uncharacterized protein
MKFIADIMVGRLARYLRMSGNDVLYSNSFDDEEILEIARKENRVILTRDTLMLERRDCRNKTIESLFIKDDKINNQLKQVKNDLNLTLEPSLSRCLECNSELINIRKEDVKNKVPPYVYETQKIFLYCSRCSKYYWRGTHYNYISRTFKKINEDSKKN